MSGARRWIAWAFALGACGPTPDPAGSWGLHLQDTWPDVEGAPVVCWTWDYHLDLGDGTYTLEMVDEWRDEEVCLDRDPYTYGIEGPQRVTTTERGDWDVVAWDGDPVLLLRADTSVREEDTGAAQQPTESAISFATGTDVRGRFLALAGLGVLREVR